MKIKRLFINNYKSLVNFELVEPNPFSVFVGPNAAGKSNVFEALEFLSYWFSYSSAASGLFDEPSNFVNRKCAEIREQQTNLEIEVNFDDVIVSQDITIYVKNRKFKLGFFGRREAIESTTPEGVEKRKMILEAKEKEFSARFSRLFINNANLVRLRTNGSEKLRIDAGNLTVVLSRLLQDENKREEIMDWLQLLIPEFEKIEVVKNELDGEFSLKVFETHLKEPLGRKLISDGTYNILALLTAVYQSDEPQFLCIEEPENGLNPYVVRTLVGFFRQMCEEKGHYIWLNTHSATLVRELRNEEIILIDKVDGITKAKQIPHDFKRYDLEMDEAWLTNALGGGLPW